MLSSPPLFFYYLHYIIFVCFLKYKYINISDGDDNKYLLSSPPLLFEAREREEERKEMKQSRGVTPKARTLSTHLMCF
jgi:hypothetical protein